MAVAVRCWPRPSWSVVADRTALAPADFVLLPEFVARRDGVLQAPAYVPRPCVPAHAAA